MGLVDTNNVILQSAVLLVPYFLGIGLIVLSNRVVDYSKRKLVLGKNIEVLSFDEYYYQKFLDLDNPNANDIHLKRLKAFNNLVKSAYTDPDAYERL